MVFTVESATPALARPSSPVAQLRLPPVGGERHEGAEGGGEGRSGSSWQEPERVGDVGGVGGEGALPAGDEGDDSRESRIGPHEVRAQQQALLPRANGGRPHPLEAEEPGRAEDAGGDEARESASSGGEAAARCDRNTPGAGAGGEDARRAGRGHSLSAGGSAQPQSQTRSPQDPSLVSVLSA